MLLEVLFFFPFGSQNNKELMLLACTLEKLPVFGKQTDTNFLLYLCDCFPLFLPDVYCDLYVAFH
jgi:hypothetical protein